MPQSRTATRLSSFFIRSSGQAGRMPYENCNFTSKRSSMLSNTEFRDKSTRSSIPTKMETGLLSADSDLINLVELDLLETLTTVNDDESMEMADDLLDLQLESMTFSQSMPLPSVSQVSYKGVCDSQAVQSQVPHKLRCKDPCRSNNNSALLDLNRPTSSCAPIVARDCLGRRPSARAVTISCL